MKSTETDQVEREVTQRSRSEINGLWSTLREAIGNRARSIRFVNCKDCWYLYFDTRLNGSDARGRSDMASWRSTSETLYVFALVSATQNHLVGRFMVLDGVTEGRGWKIVMADRPQEKLYTEVDQLIDLVRRTLRDTLLLKLD